MDIAPDTSDSYYVPTPPVEQVQEEQRQLALNQASMDVVKELIDKFDSFIAHARSVDGIVIGQGVHTDAQILAKQNIAEWCESRKAELESKYKSALEEVNG